MLVAQRTERSPAKGEVVGSNPTLHTMQIERFTEGTETRDGEEAHYRVIEVIIGKWSIRIGRRIYLVL